PYTTLFRSPQRFAARVDAFEAGLLVPAIDGTSELEMVIDEAGDDGCALDVDDLCVGTRIARHLGARAACDDTTVVDRECFNDAEGRVHGQDLAVRDDGVDFLLRKHRSARECGDYAASDSQALEYPIRLCHAIRILNVP